MIDYTNTLNPAQAEAVLYDDGPALVIAGAGSGKTRVLTYKLAHLIEVGYAPEKLMALTFTNKAAREMQERVGKMVNKSDAAKMRVGTFHSVFSRILRRYATELGFQYNFSIYDTSDSKSLVKKIVKEMQLDSKVYTPKLVLGRISTSKNRNIPPERYETQTELVAYDRAHNVTQIGSIYTSYMARCKAANAMDFDDLLFLFNCLITQSPKALEECRDSIDYLLIDEYQDTNPLQYFIVQRLVEGKNRVFAVGDDAQSIYSFRGANINNILSFMNKFPGARLFKMEENYRSSQTIVNLANSLIEHNKHRIPKKVFSQRIKGAKVALNELESGMEEAIFVANSIKHHQEIRPEVKYSSYAILYRTNAQSRLFEEQLRIAGIPYTIYGGVAFYGRAEIKNILAYLQLLHNPDNNEAFERAAKFPKKGIGDKTLLTLTAVAHAKETSLYRAAQELIAQNNATLSSAAQKSIGKFLQLLDELKNPPEGDFLDWIKYILVRSEIIQTLKLDNSEEGASRLDNVEEFVTSVQEYITALAEMNLASDSMAMSNEELMVHFLEGIALTTDKSEEEDTERDSVHLMTIHSSKGLEYDYVYVVGLEDGLFPSDRSDMNDNIEEERRLLYVAITRAREECSLNLARFRIINGQVKTMPPSRFLREIDHSLLTTFGIHDERLYRPIAPPKTIDLPPVSSSKVQEPHFLNPIPAPKRKQPSFLPSDIPPEVEAVNEENGCDVVTDLEVGDRVFHHLYGKGLVVEMEGNGNNAIATVEFDTKGRKYIILRYAKLTKYPL